MKVPPKRKGNVGAGGAGTSELSTSSMKVPPKRKGNFPGDKIII